MIYSKDQIIYTNRSRLSWGQGVTASASCDRASVSAIHWPLKLTKAGASLCCGIDSHSTGAVIAAQRRRLNHRMIGLVVVNQPHGRRWALSLGTRSKVQMLFASRYSDFNRSIRWKDEIESVKSLDLR